MIFASDLISSKKIIFKKVNAFEYIKLMREKNGEMHILHAQFEMVQKVVQRQYSAGTPCANKSFSKN